MFCGVWMGKRSAACSICSSLTAAAVISLKVSIHEYPTPSLNCSFCLHATLSGNISAKASRTIRFSISFPGHILAFGFRFMATSRNSLSRKGTRPSTPHADRLLLARRQSYMCNFESLRTVSSWNACGVGALWKYRYPPKTSSAPSPLNTILIPIDLMTRASRYMGVEARTVVTSYVSMK